MYWHSLSGYRIKLSAYKSRSIAGGCERQPNHNKAAAVRAGVPDAPRAAHAKSQMQNETRDRRLRRITCIEVPAGPGSGTSCWGIVAAAALGGHTGAILIAASQLSLLGRPRNIDRPKTRVLQQINAITATFTH